MAIAIDRKLEKTLVDEAKKHEGDTTLNAFVRASAEFDDLIKKGLVTRRGYNLLSITDKHLQQFAINSNLR
jgi:3-methyladenine DNA glycosylase Tag